jgi:hypothetical protein
MLADALVIAGCEVIHILDGPREGCPCVTYRRRTTASVVSSPRASLAVRGSRRHCLTACIHNQDAE